jgi:hypothetical protein
MEANPMLYGILALGHGLKLLLFMEKGNRPAPNVIPTPW